MSARTVLAGMLLASVAAASVSSAAPDSTRSRVVELSTRGLPLRGVPLRAPTGLRLLVTDAPAPFVLDVDRGNVERITGLPTGRHRAVDLSPLGKDALVSTYHACSHCRLDPRVYLVRHGSTAATPLARTLEVVPARDGQSVWMLSRSSSHRCKIAKIGLDGRRRGTGRKVSCRTGLVAELPAGLLVNYAGPGGTETYSALLKANGSVVRFRDWQAQPMVGNLVLSGADRRTPLLLHDMRSARSHRLRWPARPDYALGRVAGQADGRRAIVDFAKYSPDRIDWWLLDTTSRRWQHLPGMPAHLVPKDTDVGWTTDGRVVILASNVLAVWRPGEPQLSVRRVNPTKEPGSEFIVW